MHPIQKKIISLARLEDISRLSYRQLAIKVRCQHASQAKHHLDQLLLKGYLARSLDGKIRVLRDTKQVSRDVINIPIMGQANCGVPAIYATNQIHAYLKVSPSAIKTRKLDKVFALQAVGDSMNRAKIRGSAIDDMDYVLVESLQWSEVSNGDYLVSIIEDMANIKKIRLDLEYSRIILMSESTDSLAPIIIAAEDLHYYQLAGKVVEVIKAV
jgi:SOS-response transcriptional repressor LexA